MVKNLVFPRIFLYCVSLPDVISGLLLRPKLQRIHVRCINAFLAYGIFELKRKGSLSAIYNVFPVLALYRSQGVGQCGCSGFIILLIQHKRTHRGVTGDKAFKGGYILADSDKKTPDLIFIATGSEVSLAVEAKKVLKEQGVDARVVSMPCVEDFEKQSEKYKESVLPKNVRARVAIEAGSPMCWYKYVGMDGKIIGMETFGESAPAKKLFEKYGFTVDNVVATALEVVK